jgi:uncharacterized protein (DUF4415 family)
MKKKPEKISQSDWDFVDSPPLSDEILSRMEPVQKNHPEIPRKVRGSQKTPHKVSVSIRLSPEVIHYFKSEGEDWQAKIDKILYEYVKSHCL